MKKILITILCVLVTTLSFACTDFQIKTEDNAIIIGRSMEFAVDLKPEVTVHPRGEKVESDAPNGKKGLKWTSKYGFIGVSVFGDDDAIVDGFNEKGLSTGLLWLADITKYQEVAKNENKKALDILDLASWILGNFSKVSEVKRAMKNVRVWGEFIPELGLAPPLHVALHDSDGNSLVIEFIDGEQRIHDNPIGVLTNSPEFNWHITNLQNYVTVTSWNAEPATIAGVTLKGTGNGSGLFGIPGDWTPTSRFVRAAFFIHFADPAKTAAEGVNLAEHILNTVDIPHGDMKEKKGDSVSEGYTMWVVIKDLTNKVLYFRTYENLTLRSVDLTKFDLKAGSKVKSLPLSTGDYGIEDITGKLL
ncbi:linear amide C-N hydrolase [Candidatus Omnitrophota bacterium]